MARKIFVDGSFYKNGGIGRYYCMLIKILSKTQKFEIVTSVPSRLKEDWIEEFRNFDNIVPEFFSGEKFSLKNFSELSIYANRNKNRFDWFVFPHINIPLNLPKNSIVVIHDLRPLTAWWDRDVVKKWMFWILLKTALRVARYIVVPSEFSRNELVSKFGIGFSEKIKVIPPAIDSQLFSLKGENPAEASHLAIDGDYILYVGARKYHKNIIGLIKAFQLLSNSFPNLKLVIAGFKERKNDFIQSFILSLPDEIKSRIVEFERPTDTQLVNLYRNAKLLVLPSFYEGFGLPPLEAVRVGCPSLTSCIPVFVENLGKEISRLDPYSPEQMAKELSKVLSSEEERERLLNLGRKLISEFSIEKFAEKYLNLLR